MQKLVIEKPYRFIPPYRGRFWSECFRPVLPYYLRLSHGIVDVKCRGLERLKASVDAGKGVLLAPNHSRLSDPMTMGWIVRESGIHLYTMASWHLFNQESAFDKLSAAMMRRLGAFSILREGTDRTALTTAIDILAGAERPLVIFPEGVISRANDRLGPLMDGVTFITRMAARKSVRDRHASVVIHPVALRYVFLDDVEESVAPFLAELEQRLTWHPQTDRPSIERLRRIGEGLLSIKEVQYLGRAEQGDLHQRRLNLIDQVLRPIEAEWIGKLPDEHLINRVKEIRTAVLPKLIEPGLAASERSRIRRQLDDASFAQQLHFHPEEYLDEDSPPEHLLETVERLEEDLTGSVGIHGRFRVMLDIGEAIEVPSERERRTDRNEPDPLLTALSAQLRGMLEQSGREVAASRGTVIPHDLVEQPEHVAAGT